GRIMISETPNSLLGAFIPPSGPWIITNPWREPEIAPFTPQKPIVRRNTQMSWLTRSRVVVSAYPTRHMNSTLVSRVHSPHTSSPGASAKSEVIVIHSANNNVKTTSGVRGSRFGSAREHSHEIQVTIEMIKA